MEVFENRSPKCKVRGSIIPSALAARDVGDVGLSYMPDIKEGGHTGSSMLLGPLVSTMLKGLRLLPECSHGLLPAQPKLRFVPT